MNNIIENKTQSVLITLHGIGTYGIWQRNLKRLIQKYTSSFEFYSMRYGRISPLRVTIPFFRKHIEKEVFSYLDMIFTKHKNKEFHIVAHSFGTYLIMKYLTEHKIYVKIKTIILAGSLLKQDYFLQLHHAQKSDVFKNIETFINECGVSDKNLLMSKLFALKFGDGGRRGFITVPYLRIINRYFQGGHKVYFNQESYQKNWLPHILSSSKIEAIDERKHSFFLDSLEKFYISLSKMKYILYVLIFIPVVIYSIIMLIKKRHLEE